MIEDLLKQIDEIDNPCSMHGYRTPIADALHIMELNIEEAVGYASTAKSEIESAEGFLEDAKNAADSAEEEATDAQKQYRIIRDELERFKGLDLSSQPRVDGVDRLVQAITHVTGMMCAQKVMSERARWA